MRDFASVADYAALLCARQSTDHPLRQLRHARHTNELSVIAAARPATGERRARGSSADRVDAVYRRARHELPRLVVARSRQPAACGPRLARPGLVRDAVPSEQRWIDLLRSRRGDVRGRAPDRAARDRDRSAAAGPRRGRTPAPARGQGDYVFGVLAFPAMRADGDVVFQEVDVVATLDVLVTVRKTPAGHTACEFDDARTRRCATTSPPGLCLHVVVDEIAERFLTMVDGFDDNIDELEDHVTRLARDACRGNGSRASATTSSTSAACSRRRATRRAPCSTTASSSTATSRSSPRHRAALRRRVRQVAARNRRSRPVAATCSRACATSTRPRSRTTRTRS